MVIMLPKSTYYSYMWIIQSHVYLLIKSLINNGDLKYWQIIFIWWIWEVRVFRILIIIYHFIKFIGIYFIFLWWFINYDDWLEISNILLWKYSVCPVTFVTRKIFKQSKKNDKIHKMSVMNGKMGKKCINMMKI